MLVEKILEKIEELQSESDRLQEVIDETPVSYTNLGAAERQATFNGFIEFLESLLNTNN